MAPISRYLVFILAAAWLLPQHAVVMGAPRDAVDSAAIEGQWLIKVEAGIDAELLAESMGARYLGPIDSVNGYHRISFLEQLQQAPDRESARSSIRQALSARTGILKFDEERIPELSPRLFIPPDPRFPEQWHLENTGQTGGLPFADLGVRSVWDQGINGTDVTIGVIDTGIEYSHPDLVSNWDGQGRDYIGNDNDPSPADPKDRHGTSVAGISVAASNQTGVIGVAYRSRFVPMRAISYDRTVVPGASSSEIASALSHISWPDIDIYNNSWGPSDDNGVRYAAIDNIIEDSIVNGTTSGRLGKGTIYVWAAGNGGTDDDNSNFDGYNSLPYTISVAALGHDDLRASYSEKGANLLVAAPSQGRGPGILTTDNTGASGYNDSGDEFDNFNGTSAAAPMVTGVVALMLDRRPDLNWRDVQQILARRAEPVDYTPEEWTRNAAGHWVSHEYGFGRVDAEGAVALAGQWNSVGPLQSLTGNQTRFANLVQNQTITDTISLFSDIEVQFVRVRVDANHSNWGDLQIEIISPSGTRSVLSEPHINYGNPDNGQWFYLSTHFLGESSKGGWKIEISDRGPDGSGTWYGWGIEVLGNEHSTTNQAPVGEDIEIVSSTYAVQVDVLEGVTDPDGDSLEVLSVHHPRDGTLVQLDENVFEYYMGAPKFGRDYFSVLIGDGRGQVLRRMVHFVNPRPITQNDLYAITRGIPAELPVLQNDYDAEGDPLRIISVAGAYAGYAQIQPNGTILFSPPQDLTGLVRLQYKITDDVDGESTGWIALMIQETADVALQFDGVDDYLRIPPAFSIPMEDNLTAEAWIYPESFGEHVTGFGRIFDRGSFVFFLNGLDHGFYNDRSLVLYVITESGQAHAINSAPETIELNKWQHVAVSYDTSDSQNPVRMYVDGVGVPVVYPEEVNTQRPQMPLRSNRENPLYMGEADSGARAFKGSMTEFRIWNTVRSPNDINAAHDKRLTGSEAGLTVYFPLNQRLDAKAASLGSYQGTADIYEAQRVPLELPWNDFLQHYTVTTDAGNGWWRDSILGWVSGDTFPWIYSYNHGWLYTGHRAGDTQYNLFFMQPPTGWLLTEETMYPWFYDIGGHRWLWYLRDSRLPPEFFDPGLGDWLTD